MNLQSQLSQRVCPLCRDGEMNTFYNLDNVPVHSVRLLRSVREAEQIQRGSINLGYCPICGFISNSSFNPEFQDYSNSYESTQACSPTFGSFEYQLANQLVEHCHLYNKDIIEIGCGQGEFISLLCEIGQNRGTGFDPAFDPLNNSFKKSERVTIIPDFFTGNFPIEKPDFIICKMTLEHIRDVSGFIGSIRRMIGDRTDIDVFFQVPDVRRILKETAFWDIYYEHCSYFSPGSIARLFRLHGFEIGALWYAYGDQYIMLIAHLNKGLRISDLRENEYMIITPHEVDTFSRRVPEVIDEWRRTITDSVCQGERIVLWGSGSKGVAFLTTLGISHEIPYTVDINPRKQGTFMAGTGQKIVMPGFLQEYRPDKVILMNPVYHEEVRCILKDIGLFPQILIAEISNDNSKSTVF